MEQVRQLEKTAQGYYKNAPHLPKEFTKWLADNIWWLTVIGVVISVFGLLALVPVALFALGLSSGLSAMYGAYNAELGAAWISVLISIVSLVAVTIIEATAINPLKSKSRKGWELLFVVALVNLGFNLLAALANINIFSILSALVWAVIHGYFLFEIRSYFGVAAKATHKPVAKAKKV